jgi:hypothetical protein
MEGNIPGIRRIRQPLYILDTRSPILTEHDANAPRSFSQKGSQESVQNEANAQISYQNDHAVDLLQKYERSGDLSDLDEAIGIMEKMADMVAEKCIDKEGMLANLGRMLGRRFERTGSIDDVNRAVELGNMAVNATPHGHLDRADRLNNLGLWLGMRFRRIGLMDDINRAVEVGNMAVDATPHDHPDRAAWLVSLGNNLGRRFERTGSIDDINRAVEVGNMADNATPHDHPDRAARLISLGNNLGRRFGRTTSMDDINRAVELANIAVSATPHGHLDRADRLNNLGLWHGIRFGRTGSMDDVDRAVEVASMALKSAPQDHPGQAIYMYNLGNWLAMRYERTGSKDDLDRAVELANMAVDATPHDHPDRAARLISLGVNFKRRFECTGLIDDINRAVEVGNIAVSATPNDHPNRAMYLNNLGNWLGRQFDHTGSVDDLNHAVEVGNMAVDATPYDHPARAGYLRNLGNMLGRRFQRTELIDDVNRAVEIANMAVDATPYDHPDRAGHLDNLGNMLSLRSKHTESMDDVNRAVEVASMAVDATPHNHPVRATRLGNLGNKFGRRFELTESMDDLNRAVEVADMALDARPNDHPDRASHLNILGDMLSRRFDRTGSPEDLERTLTLYKEAWSCRTSPPSRRIYSARRASDILASQQNWKESCNFLQGAVELLPIVSPRLLDNDDKQHMLTQFAGLASRAAAVALEAGKSAQFALKLLELGRCVIAGLLLEMRTDLSELRQQHPELAAEFEYLRGELDSSSSKLALIRDATLSLESQATRRFKADQEFNKVVARVRDQSGFQNFLLPPTPDELMASADQGPIIIINVSLYRCDAFLVERHQIRVLPLPNLTEEELKKRAQQLPIRSVSVLQWLWDVAAGPIRDALGYHCPVPGSSLPRVWWVPTGALSHFPLHAAGVYTKASSETVLDRVMSSYSSSIKALVYGRRHSAKGGTDSVLEEALLVAMQKTPNLPSKQDLPYATEEVDMLAKLCPKLKLNVVSPLRHRKEVLAHLRTCKVFHFAGHGRSDPLDPSQSCLLLEDWKDSPLTVGDFRDSHIQDSSPFLGYLSACSTSANKVDGLLDEAVHLASAFQLAGFRHVIGTLWEVSDSHCVDVARVVYETLQNEGMTDIAVCRGLHRAVKALLDRHIEPMKGQRDAELSDNKISNNEYKSRLEVPLYWVPYVHFGV